MNVRRHLSSLAIALVVTVCLAASPHVDTGLLVYVDPPFGRHPKTVSVRMTRLETEVVHRLAKIVTTSNKKLAELDAIDWKIESTASASRTLFLSRQALAALQDVFLRNGWTTTERTTIVVARSQSFINDTLDSIDCHPDLSRTGGVHLMGETVCGHSVIVINLTGYAFLGSVNDRITPELEQRVEPPLSHVDYRATFRNLTGLAHEWAHVARATVEDGAVSGSEPSWFREGFAELVAGMGLARAFPGRVSYLDFHVIRLRLFANWYDVCDGPLNRYRTLSRFLDGCEYFVGPLAMELLMVRYGGIDKLFELFARTSSGIDFFVAFRRTFGMDVSDFESKADAYIAGIRRIGTDVS